MVSERNKQRTYARNRLFSRRGYEKQHETDGQYLLKLVLYVLLATVWIKFRSPIVLWSTIPLGAIPVGMVFGMLIVRRFEAYQFDRKLWYAILIIVGILCYFVPAGIAL